MNPIDALDRRAGTAVRGWVQRSRLRHRTVGLISTALAPSFVAAVVTMLLRAGTRRQGVQAGAAATVGALVAGALRRTIGRPRPDGRIGGALPSRHATAASTIVRAVGRRHPRAATVLAAAAAVGLTARVATGEHDPADIVAGVVLGAVTESAVHAVADGVSR